MAPQDSQLTSLRIPFWTRSIGMKFWCWLGNCGLNKKPVFFGLDEYRYRIANFLVLLALKSKTVSFYLKVITKIVPIGATFCLPLHQGSSCSRLPNRYSGMNESYISEKDKEVVNIVVELKA